MPTLCSQIMSKSQEKEKPSELFEIFGEPKRENEKPTPLSVDVGYEDEFVELDWYVTVRIPARKDWNDTKLLAEGVGEVVRKALRDAGL